MTINRACVLLAAAAWLSLGHAASAAADMATAAGPSAAAPSGSSSPAAAATDDGLGGDVFSRFLNYQKLEWGHASSPLVDPNAPAGRLADFPPQPESAPPMPFTEWPYGGTTSIGVNRPNSVDSPLMVAIAPTGVGKFLNDAHIQAYGWIDVGGNLSTSSVKGGNAPAAYDYNPNTVQLDQAVMYLERTPDTVQRDHIDWGFRASVIYGENYRYTTAFGIASYQLLKYNKNVGYDFPMVYGEIYIPQVAHGLMVRVGRFISVPDIEAQLAPNNYMYTHSMTYTFDNYTNTGVQLTLAATKNLFLQLGGTVGSDTSPSHVGQKIPNPFPNPLYPENTFRKDPGSQPSVTGCIRYQTDSAKDDIYFCADAINRGTYGYNNLQWFGVTYYHKFNEQWHLSFESYNLHQNDVPNINNPDVLNIIANGGTPFATSQFKFNAPGGALCRNVQSLKCTATSQSALVYVNYQFSPLDNLSLRAEYLNDEEGQRTGFRTQYVELGAGVQHWFSPQIEVRPEVSYYNSLDAMAFNGNSNHGVVADKSYELVASGDVIVHF